MNVPIQVDYGVRALVDLAENSHKGDVQTADIAKRQQIPRQFLAQVLHNLNKFGITSSKRGPNGGHRLAIKPSNITMGYVMRSLGNNKHTVCCLENSSKCYQAPKCSQKHVWRKVEIAVNKILDSTTIEDLINN
tara:strand:+ start:83 stop:484 length:402 start_codon:yes stop_codon:yes gene_type:complete